LTNFNHTALENVDVTTYILHPLQCYNAKTALKIQI
jgi:hypothetical protein